MTRFDRKTALPEEMQGLWVDSEDPSAVLEISVGEVTYLGQAVAYDYKEIERVDGALTVNLKIDDETEEDTFQRANITGLVITPEGDFMGYNTKFGSQFVRQAS